MIQFIGDSETIIGVYEDMPINLEAQQNKVWLLNASIRPYLDLQAFPQDTIYEIMTRDKFGRIVSKQQAGLTARLNVEVGAASN